MSARQVKTFYKEKGHRMHRDHRSKKGRRQRNSEFYSNKAYKQKLLKIKLKENENSNNW